MATVYDLKPRFQALLLPVCNHLAAGGVTANQVTLFACAWSVGHGLLLYSFPEAAIWLILLPVTLVFRMALNAIDGMLARDHGMQTQLGLLLNEITDVASDAALYLPFALISSTAAAPAVLAVVLAGLSEVTGVIGQIVGGGRRYEGPMGKSDRALAYGCLALLLGLGIGASGWVGAYLWGIVVLLVVTIFNRGRAALTANADA